MGASSRRHYVACVAKLLRALGAVSWAVLALVALTGAVLHPSQVRSRWGSPCGQHPWADALIYGAACAFATACLVATVALLRRSKTLLAGTGIGVLVLGVASAGHGRTYACITDDYELSRGPTTHERVLLGMACALAVLALVRLGSRLRRHSHLERPGS